MAMLPTVVDSTGVFGEATALPGAPPIAALVGDQQAQPRRPGLRAARGWRRSRSAPAGCSTCAPGRRAPASARRSAHGTFPIVAWSRGGERTWGAEAIMLSAGTNVDWLRDDLGIIDSRGATATTSPRSASTPTAWCTCPRCSASARRTGTTAPAARCSASPAAAGRPQVVRAVLEGVAHRGADLRGGGRGRHGGTIAAIRDRRRDEPEPDVRPGTGQRNGPGDRGVAVRPRRPRSAPRYLAGLAVGVWGSFDDIADAWDPRDVVEPTGRLDRQQWASAIARARGWIPDLSALDF